MKIRRKVSALGSAYDVQFGDVQLWRFLEAAGLGPRKSLTLGALGVPDQYFFDCARGLVDGDGSIENFVRLIVKFHSASRAHIDWLRQTIERLACQRGYVGSSLPRDRMNPVYVLALGKRASIDLLQRMYRDPSAPSLARKRGAWRAYEERTRLRFAAPNSCDRFGTIDVTPT